MQDSRASLIFDSPIGPIGVTAVDDAVVRLELGPPPAAAGGSAAARALCRRVRAELQAYLAGRLRAFTVPLRPVGSDFQQRAWQALCAIPYGATASYGAIATALGDPGLSRAVGAACGANPIPLIIPCHRVTASGGGLGGFAYGPAVKRWLLDLESPQLSLLPRPAR